MTPKAIAGIIGGFIVLLILFSCTYTVYEGQQAIVLRLGKIIKDSDGKYMVAGPGLHFKVPFITSVQRFDVRLQTLKVDAKRILTAQQKYVLVDYYAKWKIEDPALYYRRTTGFSSKTEKLLTQQINSMLRADFGTRTIKEVISSERSNIMQKLKVDANKRANNLGVEVVDVRIQGIDLPEEVRESVFQRMRTEREQVATMHRSQGKAAAEKISATADANVVVLLAQAKLAAQKVRAAGDSEAAQIYINSYSKNPGFYSFYRSLAAYRQVFTKKNTIMVLKPNGEFFKYFNHVPGKKS